jgi:catechol 2,3-dioxygenase
LLKLPFVFCTDNLYSVSIWLCEATRHALAEGFFFYVNEPGGNRFELYAGAHLVFAPDFGPYRWSLAENPNDAWGREMPWDKSGKIIK